MHHTTSGALAHQVTGRAYEEGGAALAAAMPGRRGLRRGRQW